MDKREFLERLQMQLLDLTEEERTEALEYYEEYFADAGEENEGDVIRSLGTPEQVAKQIKTGLHKEEEGMFTEKGMFTENGYREKIESDNPPEVYGKRTAGQEGENAERRENAGPLPWGYAGRKGRNERTGAGNYGRDAGGTRAGGYRDSEQRNDSDGQGGYGYNAGANYYNTGQGRDRYASANTGKKKGMSGGMIALLVILGILASPVILALGAGLLGIILGILGAAIGVIVALAAVVIAFLAAGIGLFFGGFPLLFVHPLGGIACIAIGCFLIALFLLCVVLLVLLCSKFFPWLIREVEKFGKFLSRKWSDRKEKGETV